ncbi:uncharacterized protein LOC114803572 isoform X2 [Zeugodacus cucurbitae]|uniref:uncharacterized protein LOC114803572 isoform X2 n=1 Tax=Zeugodacus cucurbitae TaxID=28588 RepID=UPI0010A74184|nr:uncharacterized protein LOC114803572 isoform X2 [Zeugodacus cucurbitae]
MRNERASESVHAHTQRQRLCRSFWHAAAVIKKRDNRRFTFMLRTCEIQVSIKMRALKRAKCLIAVVLHERVVAANRYSNWDYEVPIEIKLVNDETAVWDNALSDCMCKIHPVINLRFF